jgi:hypothetical protein
MNYFNLVPVWVWEVLVVLALLLAVLFNGKIQYYRGVHAQVKLEKALVKQTDIKSKAATVQVVTVYKDRVEQVKGVTVTLIKKVPVYVTKIDDSKCTVGNGFVSLWNSSNEMLLPSPPSISNESPSSIVLSDIAKQHVREAEHDQELYEQVVGLQNWIKGQQQVYNKK